jgi:hypothetical protein
VNEAPQRWLFRFAYILFLLVFLELSLQAFYYFTAGGFLFARVGRPIFAPDEFSVFKNKPNLAITHNTNEFRTAVYTNSVGFRVPSPGVEYSLEKDPSTYRIMLLGPSFAFGWGVNYEETFAAKLSVLLNEGRFGGGHKIEIINAGVPSMGPALQLNWYKHVGKEYRPDLVIQFIYGSMAVDRSTNSGYTVSPEGYLVSSQLTTGRWLQQTLKQLATVFYAWVIYTRFDSAFLSKGAPSGGVEGAGRELQLHGEFDPNGSEVVKALDFYDDLRTTMDAAGARLLVVYFPLSYCVHRADLSRWKHLGVANVEAQIAFDDAFCRYLTDRGISCQNITQNLIHAASDTGQRLYFWLDIHWTALGNDVAARAVAHHLLLNGDQRVPAYGASVNPG